VPSPKVAVLHVIGSGPTGPAYPLRAARTVLGRSPSCDVRLDDRRCSSRHASVLLVGDPTGTAPSICIRDLRSRNGTFVNDERITRTTWLQPPDRIRLGNTHLELELRPVFTLANAGKDAGASGLDRATLLPARPSFVAMLQYEIEEAVEADRPLAVLAVLVELPAVRAAPDAEVLDAVLSAVARALVLAVRGVDVPGRAGHDLFGVVLPGADAAAAVRVANRVRGGIARIVAGTPLAASVGVVDLAIAGTNVGPIEMLDRAEAAAKVARDAGGDGVELGR
jgi:diguanylate cyclase (GGDEF)-like protein